MGRGDRLAGNLSSGISIRRGKRALAVPSRANGQIGLLVQTRLRGKNEKRKIKHPARFEPTISRTSVSWSTALLQILIDYTL